MTLNVGIIGGGGIASHHIRGYRQAQANIVMVADVQEDVAKQRADELGCAWTTDYADLLAHDAIQAVSICTPNAFHFEPAKAAIEAGKAVLCEKPMTTSEEDAKALVRLVREHDTFFQVAYMKRHHPVMEKFKAWLPEVGTPLTGIVRCYQPMLESGWANIQRWHFQKETAGGGVLVHGGSHTLDLLHWYLGDVEAVSACIRDRPGTDLDWVTAGMLEMANGATMLLETGWIAHLNAGPNRDGWDEMIQLRGDKGILTLQTTFWDRFDLVPMVTLYREARQTTETFAVGPVDCFAEEVKDFVRRVTDGHEPIVTVEDGYRVDRLIQAIYQASAQEQRLCLD